MHSNQALPKVLPSTPPAAGPTGSTGGLPFHPFLISQEASIHPADSQKFADSCIG